MGEIKMAQIPKEFVSVYIAHPIVGGQETNMQIIWVDEPDGLFVTWVWSTADEKEMQSSYIELPRKTEPYVFVAAWANNMNDKWAKKMNEKLREVEG